MSEYIEFAVRVPKDEADSFIARFGKGNVRILGYLLGVEIVRCRDCKQFRIEPWDEVLTAQYGAPPMTCERTGDMDDVEPDGYCAWGERAVDR